MIRGRGGGEEDGCSPPLLVLSRVFADGNNKEMRIKIAGEMNKQGGGVIITAAKVVLSVVMNH